MKIAQIAPLSERVPPPKYGGTERVVYELTEGLVKRGHDVTLFASGNSKTSAQLYSLLPKSIRELNLKNPYGLNEWNILNVGVAYAHQSEFDIIHDHNYVISMPTANLSRTSVIHTVHGCFHEDNIPLYSILNRVNLVTISKKQEEMGKGLNIIGTVYNGLSMDHYPFSREHDGYLLVIARISEEKGIHYAIDVAEALDLPLIIGGRISTNEYKYFTEQIKPRLSGKIKWVGEVNEKDRNVLMSKAMCMLHPVTWPEPFGLTMIEAMACGCPVVALNQGSISEVIADGRTGFVVNSVEGMTYAVKRIHEIRRTACRAYALDKFNAQTMVDSYERIYQNILLSPSSFKSSRSSTSSKVRKM